MLIKKTSETTPTMANIVNATNNSTTDAYSCDYVNTCNSYITDEIDTGKRDNNGKPIYRKCYYGRYTTQTASVDIQNFVSNVKNIISFDGGLKGSNFGYPFYYKSAQDNFIAILSHSNTYLNLQFGTSYPAVPFDVSITLEYTKTTD